MKLEEVWGLSTRPNVDLIEDRKQKLMKNSQSLIAWWRYLSDSLIDKAQDNKSNNRIFKIEFEFQMAFFQWLVWFHYFINNETSSTRANNRKVQKVGALRKKMQLQLQLRRDLYIIHSSKSINGFITSSTVKLIRSNFSYF